MFLYILLLCFATAVTIHASCGPMKVFLLDGQSNMVGHASIEHLKLLLNNSKTHDEYVHLWNSTRGNWAERSDVLMKFDDHVGKLTVGYGAPGGKNFGTELEFGWVIGDGLCDCQKPILLLKTAWGGKDLAIDFRPPSSGKGNFSNVKPIHYGWEYRVMITTILNVLENDLPDIVPNYNAEEGYEIAGFVWFQGWNDLVDQQKVNQYEYNLANLIRDVRDDLSVPSLPFIIGGIGMKGLNPTGRGADRYLQMQQAEKNVALYPEFRNNTLYVPTGQYMVTNGTAYNGDYHYNGRADVYCHMGRAFGEGMLHLLSNGRTTGKTTTRQNPFRLRGAATTLG